ncbi:unnamed protein product [Boreogadus saida]
MHDACAQYYRTGSRSGRYRIVESRIQFRMTSTRISQAGGSGSGEALDKRPFSGPPRLRALRELGHFQDPYAPPVPPPWHRVTGTRRAFGASAPTTPRLRAMAAPVSCVACRELPEEGILSRHLFFSPAVDLAEAIDLFRAGAPDLDDDGGNIDDDASLDDVFGDSASGFSRSWVTTATVVQREKPRRMADLFGEIMGEAAAIKDSHAGPASHCGQATEASRPIENDSQASRPSFLLYPY